MPEAITSARPSGAPEEVTVVRSSGVPLRWLLSTRTIEKLELNRYMVDRFVRYVAEDLKPNSRLLDAGAGECWYKPLFGSMHYRSIDSGKGSGKSDYGGLDIVGDLIKLPIRSESFDAVLSTEVLEHISDPGECLAEMARVLRPGGLLYLSVPFGVELHQAPYDFYRYTPFGLRHLLERAGFQIEFIRPLGGYFLCVARILYHCHRRLYDSSQGALAKLALLPFRPFSKLFFRLLLPAVCYRLQKHDTSEGYALGYACKCVKPGGPPPCFGKQPVI